MPFAVGKRPACFASPENEVFQGCTRCRLARRPENEGQTYLLLGPPNGNARQALINALEDANTPYRAWEHVLALPVLRERISGVTAAFLAALPEAITADVKGTFFWGI